jgi:hypothetical protein
MVATVKLTETQLRAAVTLYVAREIGGAASPGSVMFAKCEGDRPGDLIRYTATVEVSLPSKGE